METSVLDPLKAEPLIANPTLIANLRPPPCGHGTPLSVGHQHRPRQETASPPPSQLDATGRQDVQGSAEVLVGSIGGVPVSLCHLLFQACPSLERRSPGLLPTSTGSGTSLRLFAFINSLSHICSRLRVRH